MFTDDFMREFFKLDNEGQKQKIEQAQARVTELAKQVNERDERIANLMKENQRLRDRAQQYADRLAQGGRGGLS